MKIFKHRGDIYISKSGYKSSREERILLSLLAVVIVFTLIFFILMGQKYSSFADFIAGDDVTVTQVVEDTENIILPEISGKSNFLIFETDDEQSTIHYAYLVQMDCDTKSYKVCTLAPNLTIDGQSLYDIYLSGGGALLQSKLISSLGVNIDYYIGINNSDMVEFINSLGTYIYPFSEEIKFNSGYEDDSYSVRMGSGEQRVSGNDAVNLMRYFSSEKVSISTANEIVLYGLTQLFNEENFDKADSLFRLLITNSSSNITVRDFENAKDKIMVFCYKNADITVYSCTPQYKNNQLSSADLQDIKGYFN